MRLIGTLSDIEQAQRFADFLLTEGITAHSEPEDGLWAIWVRDENDVDAARGEFERFRSDPDHQRYHHVNVRAAELRHEEQQRRKLARKNLIDMRHEWRAPLGRRAPLTVALIAICIAVAVVSNFGADSANSAMRALLFADPVTTQGSHDAFAQIARGQLWRLITPIFLHKGLLHLVFNLMWLYLLGGRIEAKLHAWRLGVMIVPIAMGSNVLQAVLVGPSFLGISGVIFGLLGFLWMKRVFHPHTGFTISDGTIGFMLFFLMLCFLPPMNKWYPVANWAHMGGLLIGMALGYSPFFGSRKPT